MFLQKNHNTNKIKLKNLFNTIYKQLNLNSWEDWYKITLQDLKPFNELTKYLKPFNLCHINALTTVFPEHPWQVHKFVRVPKHHWRTHSNRRAFFDSLASKLGITDYTDWYKVTHVDIEKHGGSGMLRHQFRNSPSKAIMDSYPEYKWKLERFSFKPKDFWTQKEHQRNFLDYFQHEYNIYNEQDWKRVSLKFLATRGGQAVLRMNNYSIPFMLQSVYPEKSWFFFETDAGSKAQNTVMKFLQKAVVASPSKVNENAIK